MKTARRRISVAAATAVLAGGLLAACDGGNLFVDPGNGGGSGNGGTDGTPPTATIQYPKPDSAVLAVGDQAFVKVRATDAVALRSVTIEAFSLRGSAALGTLAKVDRFTPKTVRLDSAGYAVKDTVITRFLDATTDTLVDQKVYVVTTATDTAGNVDADTSFLAIGGPQVQVTAPVGGATVRAGVPLRVALSATDQISKITAVRVFTSGAYVKDTTVQLQVAVAHVDTAITILLPDTVKGTALHISATATAGTRAQGTARPVDVVVQPAAADVTPPRVSFTVSTPARAEVNDTLTVTVTGTDETRVDSVGATVLAIRRTAARTDTVGRFTRRVSGATGTLRFTVAEFNGPVVPLGLDSLTLGFEVTAFAKDGAGNCATATTPGSLQGGPCRTAGGVILSDGPGALQQVVVARGLTLPFPNAGDRIADVIADSTRLFLSNLTRNRVEVVQIGSQTYGTPVLVGSEPWGLALGRNSDSLYVANSGGTNISVIPLRNAVLQEAASARIFPANELLFDISYTIDTKTGTVPPSSVLRFDYSDRPQFIAQASNGFLVYSTKPTGAAKDGTVRIYDRNKPFRSEIFTGYVDRHTANKALAVNADSAFLVPGDPNRLLVCPRRRFGDTSDPACILGDVASVSDSLFKLRQLPANAAGGRWDTRVDIGADVAEVGFSDTTFVAVSTDRNYVAVGEGARVNGRIPLFQASADSLVLRGDVRDLINNTNERVIGLGLNGDGSLGIARGNQAYFFNNTLRLQGVTASGSPAGGVAMHPDNFGYPGGSFRLSFVSGIDETGAPYVDVNDTFNFFRTKRMYIRDAVVGAITVARRQAGDPANVALRIYALTPRGVVGLTVLTTDLTP
jgi:hypothetical protein